jgi:hypothetical protein
LSLLARTYLRWTGNPHYVNIESLQISLLAGRIFFGRVTYHGPNETIVIVGGQLTWRYWLRRVRHVNIGIGTKGREDAAEGGAVGASKGDGFPCRILVQLKGLEWFVYNRSPAYDYVMEQMAQPRDEDDLDGQAKGTKPPGENSSTLKSSRKAATESSISARRASTGSLMRDNEHISENAETEEQGLTVMLRMLPIKIEINRGAVVMGNNNTPTILVAHFEKGEGFVDATRVRRISVFRHPIYLAVKSKHRSMTISKYTFSFLMELILFLSILFPVLLDPECPFAKRVPHYSICLCCMNPRISLLALSYCTVNYTNKRYII